MSQTALPQTEMNRQRPGVMTMPMKSPLLQFPSQF